MCAICERQFDEMATSFDETLAEYLADYTAGLTRDTPAQRVHDTAFMWQDLNATEHGRLLSAWYLAIAMERLTALETAGMPT